MEGSSWEMAFMNSLIRIGFGMYASIPTAMQRCRSSAAECAVSARMGVREPVLPFHFADGSGGFEPVHLGHLDIHHNQIELLGGKCGHGFLAAPRSRYRESPLPQQVACQQLIRRVVLDQKDVMPMRGHRLDLSVAARCRRAPALSETWNRSGFPPQEPGCAGWHPADPTA